MNKGISCWICGEIFQPDPEQLRVWAESGKPFDPTDWECSGHVHVYEDQLLELDENDEEFPF